MTLASDLARLTERWAEAGRLMSRPALVDFLEKFVIVRMDALPTYAPWTKSWFGTGRSATARLVAYADALDEAARTLEPRWGCRLDFTPDGRPTAFVVTDGGHQAALSVRLGHTILLLGEGSVSLKSALAGADVLARLLDWVSVFFLRRKALVELIESDPPDQTDNDRFDVTV